ncbi:MAG: T9SS type A sorting domain-containing protein [Ignavibacteriae bacterium]|nr:T9SS type A sorting domain-containing protein [Ignavibacteriota bacterium]
MQSYAQWSTDPSNNLIVGYGLLPELASDGAGGCYITYEQNLGYPRRLVLERLNRYGYKVWSQPVRIRGELPEQWFAKITEDGRGGVLISYSDDSIAQIGGIGRIRVQRVDSSGNVLWGSTGVRISLSETNQDRQAIVADGRGGCIVAWVDEDRDLRINRIDSTGTRVWRDSGKYVWNSAERPPMTSDGKGGCYTVFGIGRLQHFGQNGNMHWPISGVTVPTGARIIKTDGSAYVYLFGGKYLGFENGQQVFTLNHQKVDTTGTLLWDSLGVTIDTLRTNSFILMDFALQNCYSMLTWPQNTGNGVWDLRTQIVRNDGSTVFEYGGIPLRSIVSMKSIAGLIPSDSATAVFVWTDNRTPPGIYAQRLDTSGLAQWDTNDIALCLISLGGLKLTSDANGGCILVGWRETDFTVRAQQVSKYGNLGEVITAVDDATNRVPYEFFLYQNYPNPVNPTTTIQFDIPHQSWVKLDVFNVLGEHLRNIVDEVRAPGTYQATFDASGIPNGVYWYRLQTENSFFVRKLTVLK